MQKNWKKIALASSGAALLLGASFGAGAVLNPKVVEVPKYITREVSVTVPGPTVEKIVTKEVPIDNGKMALLEKELLKKDGDVSYLTDGLKDGEADQIIDRLELTMIWEQLAINKTKDRLFSELNKETVNGTQLRSSLMRSLYIDPEEVRYDQINFEDKDATVMVHFRFRQDDKKFAGVAKILISEGAYDDIFIDEIEEVQ